MANDKIKGITVEINGDTSQLGDSLKSINKESNSLQNELRQVEKLLKLDPSNVELLAQKQELLGKQAETAAKRVEAMSQAQAEVNKLIANGTLDKGSEEYRKFEREVASADIQLKKATDSVEDFGKTDKDVAKTNKEFEKTSDIAGKVGAAVKAVGETFAALGAAAVAAVGAAAGKVAELTTGAATYADDIATLSTQTGVATDTLQAYKYVEELVDVSTETLTSSMAKNLKSMTSAAKGTGDAAEAYKKLGVSVTNSDGSLRDSETVYWELIDALGGVSDETERNALAMSVLGKSAQDLNPLIETGSAALNEMMQEAYDAGAVLSGDTLDALLGVSDAMERMKSSGEAVKNQLGAIGASLMTEVYKGATEVEQAFAGMIATVANGGEITDDMVDSMVDSVVSLVENVGNEAPKLIEAGKKILEAVGSAAEEAIPVVLSMVQELLPEAVKLILSMVPDIADVGLTLFLGLIEKFPVDEILAVIPPLIDKLLSKISSAIPQIVSAGVKLFTSLVQNLPSIISSVVSAIPVILDSVLSAIRDNLPLIIDAGVQLFSSLISNLPAAIEMILDALPSLIESILGTLSDAIPMLVDAGIMLFTSLIAELPDIIVTICSHLPEIITSVISGLLEALPEFISAGIQLFVAIVSNTGEIIKGIVEHLPEIVEGIKDGFIKSAPELAKAGTQLIHGLWNGIQDAGAWLWEKISGFFGGVVDRIKDFFGIHSPSTLFRDQIGKNLALGLGEGFSDEMEDITKEMQDAIPTSFDDISVNAAYRGSLSGSKPVNFELVTPISIGGQKLTKVVSRVQYDEKIGRARVVGVSAT